MRLRCLIVRILCVCGVMLGGPGCSVSALRGQREERDPLIRRAREQKTAGDIQGAIQTYQRALDKKPQLARAHLELGWIFDHDIEDHVRAIYHYQRYLELRPDAEKKDLVMDLIQHARISFAASLPDKPSEAIQQIAMLKEENAALRARLDAAELARAPAAPPATRVAPAGTPAPAVAPTVPAPAPATLPPSPAPPPAVTTYVVQPGDTLSRIAGKMYGDSKKWQPIYDANRAALAGGPQGIKVGQALVVPKLESR